MLFQNSSVSLVSSLLAFFQAIRETDDVFKIKQHTSLDERLSLVHNCTNC